ncbi:MAG: hypothetical protein Q9184_004163 [Pyrenodesmia sp. 2 TL-2023]
MHRSRDGHRDVEELMRGAENVADHTSRLPYPMAPERRRHKSQTLALGAEQSTLGLRAAMQRKRAMRPKYR